jgi:hypothetical protein
MPTQTCDVNESATASESWTAGFTYTVQQLGSALSAVLLSVTTLLASSGAAADTVDGAYARDLVEHSTAAETWTTQKHAYADVSTAGFATDAALNTPDNDVAEQASSTSTVLISRTTFVNEAGAAADVLSSSRVCTQDLTSTARAVSVLFGYADALVLEHADATNALVFNVVAQLDVAEACAATDAVTCDISETNDLQSAVAAASSLDSHTVRTSDLSDGALAVDAALFPVLRSAWVMNTESAAMSRYAGLPVQSVAVIGGRYFALGDGGLYEWTGATDDGTAIQASVKTGRSTLGLPAIKRIADLIISYVCSGTMTVKISTYGHGQDGTVSYDLPAREAAAPRANRVKLGKGLASRYFQFEFLNKAGSSFGVDSATVDAAPSTNRRI